MPRKPRIELKDGILSKFIRQLNMNYAIYFNKKIDVRVIYGKDDLNLGM